MSECAMKSALAAMVPSTTGETQARNVVRWTETWHNDADQATTTAVAERVAAVMKGKGRLVGAKYAPSTAVTGTATNFFGIVIAKRTAASPSTRVQLVSFNADTPTTDDIAQYAPKDLMGYQDGITPGETDFNFAEGDAVTVAVTKAGAGMTLPIGVIELIFELRD